MSTPYSGLWRLPTFCSLSQVTHQQNKDGGWQTRERNFWSDKMKLKTINRAGLSAMKKKKIYLGDYCFQLALAHFSPFLGIRKICYICKACWGLIALSPKRHTGVIFWDFKIVASQCCEQQTRGLRARIRCWVAYRIIRFLQPLISGLIKGMIKSM